MRIGLLCLRYGWGGAGHHVQSLGNELAKLGHEVRILSGADLSPTGREHGPEIVDFGLTFRHGSPTRWSRQLRRLLRRHAGQRLLDLDVVNGNPVSGDFATGARDFRIPYVSTLHGSLRSMIQFENSATKNSRRGVLARIDHFYKLRASEIERRDYMLSNAVILVSKSVAEEYENAYGHRESTYVVPPCPQSCFFEPELDEDTDLTPLGPHLPDSFILFIGSPLLRKGLQHLLKALRILRRKGNLVQAVVATGGEVASTRALVDTFGVESQTTVLDTLSITDMMKLMRKAHLLAFPSLYEGLPLTIIEAMSQGLPVVGFDATGVRDAIRDRESGFLVPQGDVEAFCGAIEEILANASLRERMGRDARRVAHRKYHPSKIARAYVPIYESLN